VGLNIALFKNNSNQMGCPALGIWVAFLKQPDALPGRATQLIKIIYF
jgi:hypothetical protein